MRQDQRVYGRLSLPGKAELQAANAEFVYKVWAAVRTNGLEFKYVPEALKTPELCLVAVSKDGCALAYVPQVLEKVEIQRSQDFVDFTKEFIKKRKRQNISLKDQRRILKEMIEECLINWQGT